MSKKNLLVSNKSKQSLLTYPELLQLIAVNAGVSTRTVEKVYKALIDFLIEDLKVNGKVRFQWLGSFYCDITKGGERLVPQGKSGERVLKYCAPKRKVYFRPSITFEENLNEDFGVNSLRGIDDKIKKGQLIDSSSPLKAERTVAIKNLIKDEARKQRANPNPTELDEMIEEELFSDVDWEEEDER